MRLALIDGPGHHGPLLRAQLGQEVVYTRSYPHFSVLSARNAELARRRDIVLYGLVRRAASSARNRLRFALRDAYDFDLCNALYGKLAANYVRDAEAVIAFSFVAREAHAWAKKNGRRSVLELPSVHVSSHVEIVDGESQRAGQQPATEGVRFSRFAIERATQEYAQADLINVLSSYAKKTLVNRGVSAEKIIVTPLGIDTALFSPPSTTVTRPFRILYVGRIELAKGIRYLLDALTQLRLPNSELWLIGAIYSDVRANLASYSLPLRVVAPMSQQELAAIYAQCDVLVFPTLSDGFGLVMLEAMASGLPVIATQHCGAPDIVREGQDGFVVPPQDHDALAERISRLYENTDERLAFGARARASMLASFTRESYGARLQNGLIAQLHRGRDESAAAPRENA